MAPVESRTDINYKSQYLLMFQPDEVSGKILDTNVDKVEALNLAWAFRATLQRL